MTKVLMLTPSLTVHDAVSNDIWIQDRFFKKIGWMPYIFSELCSPSVTEKLITLRNAELLLDQPDNVVIYHHSVYWALGESLLHRARARTYLRYHNITPSHFFETYSDHVAVFATKQGVAQTSRLVNLPSINGFIGASKYNCDELIRLGADSKQCIDIAPFHTLADFNQCRIDSGIKDQLDTNKVNILFVGRIAPNKGHLNLLAVLGSYLERYGTSVQLNIVGNLSSLCKKYFKTILKEIKRRKIAPFVKFWGSVSLDQLHTLYHHCDVFVLLSEHEGFCVPIIEAQSHHIPVVALNKTAVGETLGPNQLCYDNFDPDTFADAIHLIRKNEKARKFLVKHGFENHNRFLLPRLEQKMTEYLSI